MHSRERGRSLGPGAPRSVAAIFWGHSRSAPPRILRLTEQGRVLGDTCEHTGGHTCAWKIWTMLIHMYTGWYAHTMGIWAHMPMHVPCYVCNAPWVNTGAHSKHMNLHVHYPHSTFYTQTHTSAHTPYACVLTLYTRTLTHTHTIHMCTLGHVFYTHSHTIHMHTSSHTPIVLLCTHTLTYPHTIFA